MRLELCNKIMELRYEVSGEYEVNEWSNSNKYKSFNLQNV